MQQADKGMHSLFRRQESDRLAKDFTAAVHPSPTAQHHCAQVRREPAPKGEGGRCIEIDARAIIVRIHL